MSQKQLEKIGKYDVIDILGQGGMGIVYRAVDPKIGRTVAIKMLIGGFSDNPDLLKRFYREAQSAGVLQHPNIVIIYDLGDEAGHPYLVMEYLPGKGLDALIEDHKPIPIVDKLGMMIQVLNGLHHAHEHGIVHRDIKPANVMVLDDYKVKLVDFGIARVADKSMTRTGQIIGTISYMSPEQLNGHHVDARTDIWSTAVMLFELLTGGVLPFDAPETSTTMLKILHDNPPPLNQYLEKVPTDLDDVLERALAKDREERYTTADEFGFEISRIQEAMKREMASEYVEQAKAAMSRQELARAKDLLQQVLKADTQHQVAKQLLNEVQAALLRQQRGDNIRQLKANAEGAYSQKAYDDALGYLEQALRIDKKNEEIILFRDTILQEKQKKEQVAQIVRKAETAQHEGELDKAVAALEEALKLDPEDGKVRGLHSTLIKELNSQKKSKQMGELLGAARREITSRRFTQAFDILQQAEKVDPTSPELHQLLTLAQSSRDQETRRKELEKYTNDIEVALSAEDDKTATTKVEEALRRYPSEPALLKLKALADKMREAAERKNFVDEQIVGARKLLDEGKAGEALALLDKAMRKAPGDTRLQSLHQMVRESAERERLEGRKTEYLQKAREEIGKKEYESAVRTLEIAHTEFENVPEINDLLQFAQEQATQQARQRKVERAAEEAQRLLAEEDYTAAIATLDRTLTDVDDQELKIILEGAKRSQEEFTRKVETAVGKARKLMEARNFGEAVTFLESFPKGYGNSTEFRAILEQARTEDDRVRGVLGAIQDARAALQKGRFDVAWTIVQKCQEANGDTPEIQQALSEIEGGRGAIAKGGVERSIRDARTLMLSRQYQAALDNLEKAAPMVPFAPPEIGSEWNKLKQEAAQGAAKQQKEVDRNKTAYYGADEVEQMLEPPPAKAGGAVAPARAPRRPMPMPEPEKSKMPLILGVVAVLIVAAAAGWYFMRPSGGGGGGGVAAKETYITVNAVPWGTVKAIEKPDGSKVMDVNEQTPVRVPIDAGTYVVVVEGPGGVVKKEPLSGPINRDKPGDVLVPFEQVDVESIIKSN